LEDRDVAEFGLKSSNLKEVNAHLVLKMEASLAMKDENGRRIK
jgi:hypothetical protein